MCVCVYVYTVDNKQRKSLIKERHALYLLIRQDKAIIFQTELASRKWVGATSVSENPVSELRPADSD